MSLVVRLPMAQGSQVASDASDLIENGAPVFELTATETVGLETNPTDIREMPDGRILLVAGTQLALGDGVRWQVYRQNPARPVVEITGVAVGPDGTIYAGLPEGIARVVFGEDGFWSPRLLEKWHIPGQAGSPLVPQASMTEAGREWVWHSLTGPVFSWRPDAGMSLLGYVNTFQHAFQIEGRTYVCEGADGTLLRADQPGNATIIADGGFAAITCSQALPGGKRLVGTYGQGLKVFDGKVSTPFTADPVFSGGWRINDLCRTEAGYFAAAVDNFGVLIFREDGRTVQMLNRDMDNRLTRVKRLLPGRGGVIWGLFDGGVLRFHFPADISSFEYLFGQGITTVHPYRIGGRLWWLADGKIYRGIYDQTGRLQRLELDTPSGEFVNAISGSASRLIAGTEQGAYVRTENGWRMFAPDLKHLRILDETPQDGRWLFSARNLIGWLRPAGDSYEIVESYLVPELTNVFNKTVKDRSGTVWMELGVGRIGRVRIVSGQPEIRVFTEKEGLAPIWPQVFVHEGTMLANLSDRVYHFDETQQRFVLDADFLGTIPGVKRLFGRPGVDARGRLWAVLDGTLQVRKRHEGRWDEVERTLQLGFQPYYLSFESDGVVWMHAQHRLVRYDPQMPLAREIPVSAHLIQLTLAGGKKNIFQLRQPIPPLPFSENSLVASFVARGNQLGAPVTFDMLLEGGSGKDWLPVGSGGSTSLDHLKEGQYVLHVRPRMGTAVGVEDAVAFTILPPWYRSSLAYGIYGVGLVLVLLLAVWLSTFFERRENARLERLVAERTSELSFSNLQLAGQMDEIRNLTQAINQSPVALFITNPDGIIEYTNPRSCLLTSYTAAQLTGSNISRLRTSGDSDRIGGEVRAALARGEAWEGVLTLVGREGRHVLVRSIISPIFNQEGRVRHHLYLESDITEWSEDQQRRRRLEAQLSQAQKIESIGTLAGGIAHDFNNILTGILGYCELARMAVDENTDVRPELQQIRTAGLRAKDLVKQILTFSRKQQTEHTVVDLSRPVAEALKLIRATTPTTIAITQELESGNVKADASQIHQIIVNLCTNAVHAIGDAPGQISVLLRPVQVDEKTAAETPDLKAGPAMRLTVMDTGHGMDAATLERIFDPFFTTKPQGKGTGLGLSIVQGVIASHGGALQVFSEPAVGTTFEMYFPMVTEAVAPPPASHEPVAGSGQEVLLVDDEALVAEFAVARLRHFGYRPMHFTDPRDALRTFQLRPQRFAAVITDLTMPHLTGLDLLDEIRAVRADIPAVILTGYGAEATREKIRRLPYCALLQKPFSGEDLVHLLGQLLAQKSTPIPRQPA